MDFYVVTAAGERAGPYSFAQMQVFWASGKLTKNSLYWTAGLSEWKPVSELEYRFGSASMPSSTPPVVQALPVAEKPKRKGLGCGSGCLFFLLIGSFFLCVCYELGKVVQNAKSQGPGAVEAAEIYAAPSESVAIQKAKKFVVGTWSSTSQNQFWHRWIIKEDGTVLAYTANQNDSGWGEPSTYDWRVTKKQYTDTGGDYYLFHGTGRSPIDGAINAIIEEDGSFHFMNPDPNVSGFFLSRGDTANFTGK